MGYENCGRRPKPTALHVLRGNPSKKKLNEAEPQPPDMPIVKPGALSAAAGGVWDEVAPICIEMRTLTAADVKAFASYCELQATFTAEAQKKDMPDGGFSARLERETASALRPYYEKFGLDPSGRARLSVPKKVEQPRSKWAGVLK